MSITIFIITCYFFLLYFLTYKKHSRLNFLSPIKLISFLYLIRNIPYLLFTSIDQSYFNEYVLDYFRIFTNISLEDAFLKYTWIQTVAFISLLIGIKVIKLPKSTYSTFRKSLNLNYNVLKLAVNTAFLIGFIGFLIFLDNVGGLNLLINNLVDRVTMQSGQYAIKLKPLLSIATVFSIYLIKLGGGKNIDKLRSVIFLIITLLIFSSTGGRKESLYLIAIATAAYHFYVKQFSFKNIRNYKTFLLIGLIISYIFVIPLVRSKDGVDKLISGEVSLIESIKIPELFSTLSYTYIDVFTVNHFSHKNSWDFSSLLTIPSNIFDRKEAPLRPPMDEGVYFVTSVTRGGDYKPLSPRNTLREFSFPIENMGFAYANALLLGVIIFFFLQGLIFGKLYSKLINSGNNVYMLYIYIFCIFNFNFSSLRIMNLLTLLFLLLIFYLIYRFFYNLKYSL